MATIKANLSAVGNACLQDSTPKNTWPLNGWYAFLNNCDGTQFVKAGKEYGPFPIDHGYVEIPDVPPGRYILFAMLNPFPVPAPIPASEAMYQSNFVSHFAIIDVCCGCDDICVTLYNSGWHYCWQIILYVAEMLRSAGKVEDRVVTNGIEQMKKVFSAGQPLATDKELIRHMEKFVAKMREAKRG